MTVSTPAPATVDLGDPHTFADHELDGFWRTLRDTAPVYWNPPADGRRGFWVISRYDDIMATYRDNVNFTSERGNVLVTLLGGGDAGAGRMLAVTDGHRHHELRKILQRVLSPRVLNEVAQTVRVNTRQLIREAVESGGCDFAERIASRIPMTTISNLLGVPGQDRDFLLSLTKTALSTDDEDVDEVDSEMARNEILMYFMDLVEERRESPGDDVISMLIGSAIDGVPLSDEDVVLNCYSLIIGGDETSRLTMIDCVHTLADRPEQWRRLKHGEVAVETAVDEVLRWASPTMHFGRSVVHERELHGVRLRPGEIVTLWHASGNRDERVFARPGEFDLGRTPNKHLAFGYGPHFCVGSYLAKVEISELLLALRDFTTGFEQTDEALRIRSNFLTGFSTLPVRFRPDHRGLKEADR
ncbi:MULTISPECIES: cytochrome P450 [unclassified Streptomyces]|uniref:cytochrome P450 n=1 Tax=unclassified Streptomyces TaxID=2593676 RepID=UPI0008921C1C|nr:MULTISPECIES: cytochrome P450 [unclassified Streptomyces]PBC86578.1 cytochrome P450 [Streptomyces sp. 2321.6]SDQ79517.1 Cytochrome P450 [Streptomyces sp. KS_16]SEE02881.1 Cytochrome P450 [Streptomyces sp. 2133.1]SNC73640.1 Cytochrome P450 [Streptomyces sp. 2114.4]